MLTAAAAIQLAVLRALSCYLRHSRIATARWRMELCAIRLARRYGQHLGHRTVRTKHGFRMKLDLNDWVDQHIYATGEYEPDVVSVSHALLPVGGMAIDVGANIGFFSLLFAKLVGTMGRVISFEPAPATRSRLADNLELNGSSNIVVESVAASDAFGEVTFDCGPANHSGVASLRRLKDTPDRITVQTAPLDEILPRDQRIDLIKIDVEGAEHKVITGMQRTVKRWQPDLIVEVSDTYLREMGSCGRSLSREIMALGYSMLRIDWNGLVPVNNWSDELPDQFNALFTARTTLPGSLNVLPI